MSSSLMKEDMDDAKIDLRSGLIGFTLIVLVVTTVVMLEWSLSPSNEWIHKIGGQPNEYLNRFQYNWCTRVDLPSLTTNMTFDHHCSHRFPSFQCMTLSSFTSQEHNILVSVFYLALLCFSFAFTFTGGPCSRFLAYYRHPRNNMVFFLAPPCTHIYGFITLILAIIVGIMVNFTYNSYIYLNMPLGPGLTVLNLSQLAAFLTAIVLAYWLGWHAAQTSSLITIESI